MRTRTVYIPPGKAREILKGHILQMKHWAFSATSRTKIKEINLLMLCEGKELVLKNCSEWLGKYGAKQLESSVNAKQIINH